MSFPSHAFAELTTSDMVMRQQCVRCETESSGWIFRGLTVKFAWVMMRTSVVALGTFFEKQNSKN
jgi:hypothetical protein